MEGDGEGGDEGKGGGKREGEGEAEVGGAEEGMWDADQSIYQTGFAGGREVEGDVGGGRGVAHVEWDGDLQWAAGGRSLHN